MSASSLLQAALYEASSEALNAFDTSIADDFHILSCLQAPHGADALNNRASFTLKKDLEFYNVSKLEAATAINAVRLRLGEKLILQHLHNSSFEGLQFMRAIVDSNLAKSKSTEEAPRSTSAVVQRVLTATYSLNSSRVSRKVKAPQKKVGEARQNIPNWWALLQLGRFVLPI